MQSLQTKLQGRSAACSVADLHAPCSRQVVFAPVVEYASGRRACQGFRSASAVSGGRVRTVVVRASSAPSPFPKRDARLVLENGSVWHATAFGASGTEIGEVVFNTSLTGYQEIMTDPSYKGQFVAFTCPHIGNVGINNEDMESSKCHLGAIIVRDLSCVVSNYRSKMSLDAYCKKENVIGLANVDTRALTKVLRETGCLVGVVTTDASKSDEELISMAKSWTIVGKDLLSVVSCTEPYEWGKGTTDEWEFNGRVKLAKQHGPFHVVAYDFGIKTNILRRLASFGCRITVVPATYPASEVLKMNPDGVFFSNGPGDPSAAPYAVDNAKAILGKKPVFGICMGHQVLGQAFGGKTFKLKFGHHGGNHPIRYMPTGRVEISAQNHNFAVDPTTLPAGVEVTHINLNDGTCAGMVYKDKKAMTIQYHPEASPGPHDADICFEQFVDMMRAERV
ncbi:hypothetical protein Vafri_8635 [Volvox africanus]|uniref:Carbamoyl phosphate synthase arginine-specific small chain n=1 Tax=Volvox africanus TaxID=51714 RepID=A0A8J4EZ56_9CHLO|nr:hypothetical protein Vafri_8635 [Volvox africanus]